MVHTGKRLFAGSFSGRASSARVAFALAIAASAAACATGQLENPEPDAGDCLDVSCVDAGGGGHDGSSVHDAPTFDTGHDAALDDATSNDGGASDATQLEADVVVPVDAQLDAPIDALIDAPLDASPDATFDGGIVCGNALSSAARRYGNLTPLSGNSQHQPNDLLGMPVTIAQGGTFLGFGAYGRSAGPHVVLSLYTEVAGRPGVLVAQTSSVTTCVGTMEPASTAQPQVAAGNYWIMGVWDVTGSVGFDTTATTAQVDWVPYAFSQTLPATYPSSSTRYSGQAFNYYVVVQ